LEREAAKKKAAEGSSVPVTTVESVKATVEVPQKKEYTETLIQIRFKDGNSIKATFKPTDPIRTVFNHVALLLGESNFSLVTTFPRRTYAARDTTLDSMNLSQAELVPSGTFIVQ